MSDSLFQSLPVHVLDYLKKQAALNKRTLEEEVIEILTVVTRAGTLQDARPKLSDQAHQLGKVGAEWSSLIDVAAERSDDFQSRHH